MDNNILSVRLDLAEGAYIVSRNDGEEVIVKKINDGVTNHYAKDVMNRRLKEIEKIEGNNGWIASELLKRIDPVLYDALEEFDTKYGTEYRHAYAKTATMQITYTEVGVPNMSMRNKRIYERKASKIRTEKLQKAGISIEYDTNLLKAEKSIRPIERIRAMRIANKQKAVGAKVGKNQGPSIIERITSLRNTISQRISDMRTQRIQKKLEATQKKLEASIPRDENGLIDDVPELSEEELAALNLNQQLASSGIVVDIQNSAKIEPITDGNLDVEPNPAQDVENAQKIAEKVNPVVTSEPIIIPEPIKATAVEHNVAGETRGQQAENSQQLENQISQQEREAEILVAAEGTMQPKAKKAMSRSKLIQESKKAAREAGKMKNAYKDIIRAREEAKATATQRRKEAAERKAEADKIAAEKAKQEAQRLADIEAIERELRIRQEIAAEEARLAAEEAQRKINDKKITVRFTRKLKNIQDSIRNKVHIPNLTGPQKKIAGVVTAAALVAALGVGVAATFASANAEARANSTQEPQSPAVVEVTETHRPEMDDLVYRDIITNQKKNQEKPIEQQVPVASQETEQKSQEDIRREYLSSIRIGSNMKIESGRYFTMPNGTGNFGHFENYKDGSNRLTMIDVLTAKDGLIIVTDSNFFDIDALKRQYPNATIIADQELSLYDLKQQYPDAEFSYHFEFVHSNGKVTRQGWLTQNSMEQEVEIEIPQQADEGR